MTKKINEMFFLKPWAIQEDVLIPLSAIIERHLDGVKLSASEIEAATKDKNQKNKNYEVRSGIAYIPIFGVISKRSTLISRISQGQGTSTVQIREDIDSAISDDSVKKIILQIDSPGGSVDGVAELSDYIFSLRGKKPILAHTDGQMASAAYWIGSAADKIYANKSASVGSIGVYMVVQDYSVMEHNRGIKTDIIKAGKNKAAGNPHKPVSESDRESIQDQIDAYYELFIEGVSRNRGISKEKALQLGNGRSYIGKNALEIDLVDAIKPIDSLGSKNGVIGNLNKKSNSKTKHMEVNTMEYKDITIAALKAERPDLVAQIIEDSVSAEKDKTKALIKDSVDAERLRIIKIQESCQDLSTEGIELSSLATQQIKDGISADVAISDLRMAKLKALENQAPKTPGANDRQEEGEPSHMSKAEDYKDENNCTWAEALSATAEPRKK